ncbi:MULTISPECIES: undecaprenyl diphosphate synthase family protein [Clostridia]|uniref:Dihydroorotate dehydrogenase n=1 Tax=Lacrimispora celerecrescens TaxID=29354 RepID=A0A084JM24_9FIRM|nr:MULTISPECIES: undecaprenyl diphosphate synthase family protein [Clostridia]KEZ90008.1 dihydroorotate dehydrogenase [Lacrimispora celerecrescens]MBW4847036.1 undecaprenyl diphosphate synthase family protein [Lachnospiraceae bacterium]MSS08755.1 undecaprenyl diphosphate synthase family protein [Clostridium sp. WB02_MRS01]
MRIPKHIGIIPDGNRRWALGKGMEKEAGYDNGISPGMVLYHLCRKLGINEMTFYGFTVDNTKRPSIQREAFSKACVKAVEELSKEDAELLVLGKTTSAMFPEELKPYTNRHQFGNGGMKINFLVNYSWEWDLGLQDGAIGPKLKTADVSRIDLVIRWGGRRRLSGFLPVQSVYSDMYVIDDYWPDFTPQHVYDAIEWYSKQDVTLGG